MVAGAFEFVAGVAFAGVDVGHGDAGFGGRGGGGCRFGGLGAEEGFVKETVESTVLRLWSTFALVDG